MITRTIRPLLLLALGAGQLAAQQVRATAARIDADLVDGIATVRMSLDLHNDGGRIGEADWIVPLPEGAVADGFTTRIGDGPVLAGEVLDAAGARGVYESIVRRRRDPGLLEYAGRGCLRARLFPIAPGQDAKVEVRWRQVLPELSGLLRWTQPVAACGIDGMPPQQLAFAIDLRTTAPLRSVISPTPGADVRQFDEHHAKASFETVAGAPQPRELALYYGVSPEALGLHVITQRPGEGDDGFFTLLVSPKLDWKGEKVPPRTIVFVLDVSGSMAGAKFDSGKRALHQFLQGLRDVDRFDIVPFSTDADPFFAEPVPADAEHLGEARKRIADLQARGGTNIEAALRRGIPGHVASGSDIPLCVFLTDGLPTAGTVAIEELRGLARTLVAERDARVFVVGVGDDVNTVLLDDVADQGRGLSQYVRNGEDIEEKVSDLCHKIGRPVMTDLALAIDGVGANRVAPTRLPDLFEGQRLIVTGRYAKPGRHAVRLCGKVGGIEKEFVTEVEFAAQEGANDFVPKLWATRRVATLLEEIRRNGTQQELLDEVRRLGVEFQIVTPYTSHLVVEQALGEAPPLPGSRTLHGPGPVGPATAGPGGAYRGPGDRVPPGGPVTGGIALSDSRGAPASMDSIVTLLRGAGGLPKDASQAQAEEMAKRIAGEMQRSAGGLEALRNGRATGAGAVDDSVCLGRLLRSVSSTSDSDEFYLGSGTQLLSPAAADIAALFVRRIADKVFVLHAGVWTDRAFDADHAYAKTTRVTAFSDEYFALCAARSEILRYVALSSRMKFVLGDEVIEIEPPAPSAEDAPKAKGG